MSVYEDKRSPYWQYDFQYQGRRFHGSTGVTTKAKAEAVERQKRLEAATGQANRPKVPTLDVACGDWWEAKGKDLASAKDLEARIALCIKLIGANVLVTDITTATVATAIKKRRGIFVRGKTAPTNATVNRDIICTLRPILKRAAKLTPGTTFPVIDWTELRLAEPKPKPKRFTVDELERIRAALPECLHEFARFQSKYGPRLAGMFFHPEDVDLETASITLRKGKNGEDHIIPITSADLPWIAARVTRARAAGLSTIWYRQLRRGKLRPITYRYALEKFMEAMTKSGLRETKDARGSHALRHHTAMTLLGVTGDIRTAQKVLGHVSLQSTQVYAHAMLDGARAALEAVELRNSPGEPEAEAEKAEIKQASNK